MYIIALTATSRAWADMLGHGRACYGKGEHARAWASMLGHGRACSGMGVHSRAWTNMLHSPWLLILEFSDLPQLL